MSVLLGTPVVMSGTWTDSTGAAVDPTSPTLTITHPNGTTTTPALVHGVTGYYSYTYTATEYGFHHWVIASNLGGVEDSFNVTSTTSWTLVSLADAKGHINDPDSADDAEMRDKLRAATSWVNTSCGYSIPTTITETVTVPLGGASSMVLNQWPVLSVTSITPVVTTIGVPTPDVTKVAINADSGIITLSTGLSLYGTYNVVYVAGRRDATGATYVPDDLQELTLLLFGWLWETQRGSSTGYAGLSDDDEAEGGRYGHPLPSRAEAILDDYLRPHV